MKKILFSGVLLILTACNSAQETSPIITTAAGLSDSAADLLSQMQQEDPAHYESALNAGAEIIPTSDGRSFYLYWTPSDFNPETDGFIVALHGHDGFVSAGFSAWEPFLEEHHYGYMGLQWWFGEGEKITDYYAPTEMYPLIREALEAHNIPTGRVLFEGFSRGSANSYAVEAMDNANEEPFFLVTVSNSGGLAKDYPANDDFLNGAYGEQPFEGVHWIFYCGELDPDEKSNCTAMEETKKTLEALGANTDLFIDDANGDHGGFHLNEENAEAALAVYDLLLSDL